MEKLQPLAEQLNPLESSYADVRFLDVDYEQSAKQYESILEVFRKEIDEENEMLDLAKQFEAELSNLQAVALPEDVEQLISYHSNTITELTGRLNNLKHRIVTAKKHRQIVVPSVKLEDSQNVLNELSNSVDGTVTLLKERAQQKSAERIHSLIQQLQQHPTAQGIQKAEEELRTLSLPNDITHSLLDQLKDIKQTESNKEKTIKAVEHQIETLVERLSKIQEKCLTATANQHQKSTSKRQRKVHQKPAFKTNRRTHVEELERSMQELNSVILPSLTKLEQDLSSAQVDS